LPARTGLPLPHGPVPAGPAAAGPLRHRPHRTARRRRGAGLPARRREPAHRGGDLPMTLRLDHATTSGTFSLDGETHEVENNVWVLGDDEQCLVLDAPHDVTTVQELVGDRECVGILLTHAHDDHVRMAPELSEALEAPILLNPADREVWQLTHGDLPWDGDVTDGDMFTLGGVDLEALHTPGHSPGSTCYYCEELGA